VTLVTHKSGSPCDYFSPSPRLPPQLQTITVIAVWRCSELCCSVKRQTSDLPRFRLLYAFAKVGLGCVHGTYVHVVIGNKSVPIQLAQCRFPGLAISNAKILISIFQIKYTEAILSISTRKLLWFEITKLLIAV